MLPVTNNPIVGSQGPVPEVGGAYGKYWAADAASVPTANSNWGNVSGGGGGSLTRNGPTFRGSIGSEDRTSYWEYDGSNDYFISTTSSMFRDWGRSGYNGTLEMLLFPSDAVIGSGKVMPVWDSLFSGTANTCIQSYSTANAGNFYCSLNSYPPPDQAAAGFVPYGNASNLRWSHILWSGAWGTGFNMDMFVNGASTFSGQRTTGWTSGQSTRFPRIGASEFAGRWFQGGIAAVQVWNRALTDAEALQQFLHWDFLMKIRDNL